MELNEFSDESLYFLHRQRAFVNAVAMEEVVPKLLSATKFVNIGIGARRV